MTLRKRKEVDDKVEMQMTETTQIIPLDYEDSLPKEKKKTTTRIHPKALFTQRLAKANKRSTTGEIMKIFK